VLAGSSTAAGGGAAAVLTGDARLDQGMILSMGKADRNRNESARARIAAQRKQQLQAEKRRRTLAIGGVAVAVLVVIGIVVGALVSHNSGSSKQSGTTSGPLPASVQADLTVPVSTLTAVGLGSADTSALSAVTGPALTSGGKPQMLYIGAEWCPYCAAMRWAMAVALSRFGSFSPLKGIHSSSSDIYPNTATLTFYKSTYTSKYLVFTPIENEDVNHNLLVAPTPAQQALWTKYEPPGTGYPFIDIGNRFVAAAIYNPQVLAGLSWSQIAADLHNPSSPVAQGAVGTANLLTAAICKITGNAPANVCTAAPVTAIEPKI
jgi:thiol-disulfide isomerase/thioredoxin